MLSIQVLSLIATTLYQASAILLEDQQSPPGQLIDVGGYRLHLCVAGEAKPTIVLEHISFFKSYARDRKVETRHGASLQRFGVSYDY